MSALAPVPWHKRLGFRLALLLALTMLAFDFVTSSLEDGVFAVLALSRPLHVQEEGYIQTGILHDAQRGEDGGWLPSRSAFETFETELRVEGLAFAWLDTGGTILHRSAGLPFEVGAPWTVPFEPFMGLDVETDPPRTLRTVSIRVHKEGEVAGTLVSFLWDAPQHAKWHGIATEELGALDGCEFSDDAASNFAIASEYEDAERWRARVSTTVSITIVGLTAFLLALAVSRLVTGRLSRLSSEASTPVGSAGELPGPFSEAGRDEIGVLARAMNAMRRRVLELVDRLAARDTERREWVAQVSHDLRTPLTALVACLDRAEGTLARVDDDAIRRRARETLAVARLDADRINVLTEDLLEIARIELREPLRLEPVPPGELVRQAVRGLEPIAETAGIELTGSIEPDMPIPQADGRRVMRALENLIRNAIEHARKEVRVLVGPIDAPPENAGVRFEVQDDGPGIPVDGEAVFGELRERRANKDSAGLGLAVAEKVAEMHGGRVGAFNLPGGGASFWLELPLAGERRTTS